MTHITIRVKYVFMVCLQFYAEIEHNWEDMYSCFKSKVMINVGFL